MLDLVPIFLIVACAIFGAYRGFLVTSCKVATYVIAWVLAFLLYPVLASIMGSNANVQGMINFTEGSAHISHEMPIDTANRKIDALSTEDVEEVLGKSNLVYPYPKLIKKAISKKSFSKYGIETLGDYMDYAVANSSLNIICFTVLFALFRAILGFIVNLREYKRPLPVLRKNDSWVGAAAGALNGCLLCGLLFAIIPIMLAVLNTSVFTEMVASSKLVSMLYKSSFILMLVRPTL